MENTTIAAISTAYGEAGIGIVRMSGPDAKRILSEVFVKKDLGAVSFIPRHMHYGLVIEKESGKIIDEALAVYMNAPNTYTGEDVAEIQCHGGNLSVKNILSLLLKSGAVLADKGEFTKRAFLNGKMDLSQAEAVIDLIKAKTGKAFDCAVSELNGSVSERVKEIRKSLLDLLVSLTVNMDYPDEDIEEITYKNIEDSLSQINDELLKLKDSFGEGRILREGLRVAIVGKPNVGKSSLMNLLLGQDRSIVTSIPGTTRDTIEESASIRGIPVEFIDTAGIRESEDYVESIGIERSKDAFNRADLLILVLDASSELSEEDRLLMDMAKDRPCITVLNKIDLGRRAYAEGIEASFKNGTGLDRLEDAVVSFVDGGVIKRRDDVIITNVRHADLIDKALAELKDAMDMTARQEAMDFIEVNVKLCFDYLGEITGDTASDEVINEVFSRFCLGK